MANTYTVKINATVDLAQAKAQMDAFMKSYQNMVIGGGSSKTGSTSTSGVTAGIQQTAKAAKASTTMLGSFTSELKNLKSTIPKVAAFGVATAAIGGFTTAIREGVGAVAEMDKQLTEYRKVSDLTGASLDQFVEKATKMGREVARTGSEMVEAATEFKKSGFSDFDSLELARVSTMFQNVADSEMSAGDAASFIISQLKAFNMTASQAEHVIDAVNEVYVCRPL